MPSTVGRTPGFSQARLAVATLTALTYLSLQQLLLRLQQASSAADTITSTLWLQAIGERTSCRRSP